MALTPECETWLSHHFALCFMSLFLVMFFIYIHFFPLQTNLKRMKWRLVKPFSCTHVSCKPVVIGSPSPLEASQGIAAWACVCVHVISGGRTVPVRSWPGALISRGGRALSGCEVSSFSTANWEGVSIS